MSAPTGFDRLLPRRIWTQSIGLRILLWSSLAAISIVVVLCIFALLVDLLVHHGHLVIAPDDAPRAVAFFGFDEGTTLPAGNTGLMPTAWALRNINPVGQLLAWGMRNEFLRTNRGSLFWLIFAWASFAALWTICRSRIRTLSSRLAAEVASRVRSDLHRQSLRVGLSGLDNTPNETVVSLFLRETGQIWDGVFAFARTWWREILTSVLVLLLLLRLDWRLTLQAVVPLAAAVWLYWYERRAGADQRRLAIDRASGAVRALSEGLGKPRLVRGYSMEHFEHEQFQTYLDRLTRDVLLGQNLEGSTIWTARAGIALLSAIVLFLIGARVLSETNPISLAVAATFLVGFGLLIRSVNALKHQVDARLKLDIASNAVQRYLLTIPEVSQAVGAKFIEPVSKSIIFENVTYAVGSSKPLLERFDLRIPARSSVAVVSFDRRVSRAIAYMLPRFIEPQAGRVLFDSEDVAWGTLESIRAEMLYVGGDDPLFTGTVLQNITCGDAKYTTMAATDAAKMVHAHQFIQKLPQGYETLLGEHGDRLDAGQSFRIGLARAALRNPACLVVEEPEITFDSVTKDAIDDAYSRLMNNRTVIFLPTRLSTVRRVDQVVLVNEGRVEAIGPYADLVTKSDLFRHWEYTTYNVYKKG